MNKLKKAFSGFAVLSIFCIVMGIALIIDPNIFTRVVGLVVGGIIAAMGAASLINYFLRAKSDPENARGLVSGVILTISGVFIMVRPDFIPKVIAFVFGAYMLISGITNIQGAMLLKQSNNPRWTKAMLPAVLTALTGILLVVNPLLLANVTFRLLGICLLVSGLTNIGGSLLTGRNKSNTGFDNMDSRSDGQKFIDID